MIERDRLRVVDDVQRGILAGSTPESPRTQLHLAQLDAGFYRPTTDAELIELNSAINMGVEGASIQAIRDGYARLARLGCVELSPAQFALTVALCRGQQVKSTEFAQPLRNRDVLNAIALSIQLRPGPHPASPKRLSFDSEVAASAAIGNIPEYDGWIETVPVDERADSLRASEVLRVFQANGDFHEGVAFRPPSMSQVLDFTYYEVTPPEALLVAAPVSYSRLHRLREELARFDAPFGRFIKEARNRVAEGVVRVDKRVRGIQEALAYYGLRRVSLESLSCDNSLDVVLMKRFADQIPYEMLADLPDLDVAGAAMAIPSQRFRSPESATRSGLPGPIIQARCELLAVAMSDPDFAAELVESWRAFEVARDEASGLDASRIGQDRRMITQLVASVARKAHTPERFGDQSAAVLRLDEALDLSRDLGRLGMPVSVEQAEGLTRYGQPDMGWGDVVTLYGWVRQFRPGPDLDSAALVTEDNERALHQVVSIGFNRVEPLDHDTLPLLADDLYRLGRAAATTPKTPTPVTPPIDTHRRLSI